MQAHDDALSAHVLTSKGKVVKDCTSTELVAAGPATHGLTARVVHNQALSKVLKTEKAQTMQDAISARWAQWEADGRPADEITVDNDGNFQLLLRRGG